MISVMDVGGTHVTAANVDPDTRVVVGRPVRVPMDGDAGADAFVDALVDCASRLPPNGGNRWAVALPGPFDYREGIARYRGVGKFDALRGFDLRGALLSQLPGAASISFHNDAEAFLAGEVRAGAGRGHDTLVGLTLGTGIGSCFRRGGRVVRDGPGVPPEGRVDLLEIGGRPLEETVSRKAIRHAYARAVGAPRAPDLSEIAERARQGEYPAAEVFQAAFRALGSALAPCVAAFAPTVLVVGGSVSGSWDLVSGPLRAGLGDAGCAVEPAAHLDTAALIGAALLGSAG